MSKATVKPKRYRLLAGNHFEGRKRYRAGAIVKSLLPLDEMFGAAKFQNLDAAPAAPGSPAPDTPATPETPETPAYELKHTGGGWYDVLDPEGAAVNTESLRKDQAELFVAEELGGVIAEPKED